MGGDTLKPIHKVIEILRLYGNRFSLSVEQTKMVRCKMLNLSSDHILAADWHLLLCKPNQNSIVCRQLKRMGFDMFMPMHKVERRVRGRVRWESAPVFKGYVFISAGQTTGQWHKLRSTPGVAQLIGFGGGAPALVPAGVVAGLMERCDANGLLQTDNGFVTGERVRITSGPFADFVSTIEHVDSERRVHVLLDLLGSKTRVNVDPARVIRTV